MIVCDRCHIEVGGAYPAQYPADPVDHPITFTAGYYLVDGANWRDFQHTPDEHCICDRCMLADPRYIRRYGPIPVMTVEVPMKDQSLQARAERHPEGWIGVDFDGTLAEYFGWGHSQNGQPIPIMVDRVKRWRAQGLIVKIFTARVAPNPFKPQESWEQEQYLRRWCQQYLGEILPVTCVKDFQMLELWDDRAVQVSKNTGNPVDPSHPEYRTVT